MEQYDQPGGVTYCSLYFFRPFLFNIVSLPEKLPIFGGLVVNPESVVNDGTGPNTENGNLVQEEAGQDYSDDMGRGQ